MRFIGKERGVIEMLKMIRDRFFKVDLGEKIAMIMSEIPDIDSDDEDKISLQEIEKIRKESIAQGIQEGMEKGLEKGIVQGILEHQRNFSISIFKRKYPQKECPFLENLTSEQYEIVINMLLDDKSIEEINKAIQNMNFHFCG